MIASWSCPQPGGTSSEEYGLALDRGRDRRLLIVPALFDEANRLRRFTAETMRLLDTAGIDCFLPDLPGTNESIAPLARQTLETWRQAMAAAGRHFGATHVLALRGGALVAPALPAFALAPVTGAAILRQMIRARIVASREVGLDERTEALLEQARIEGITLSGYQLSAGMVTGLQEAAPVEASTIPLGGPPLWLRAEPGEDPVQSAALADHVVAELAP